MTAVLCTGELLYVVKACRIRLVLISLSFASYCASQVRRVQNVGTNVEVIVVEVIIILEQVEDLV